MSDKKYEQESELQNARIYLDLTRHYLDHDDEQQAGEAFAQAQQRFTGRYRTWSRGTRSILECRMKLRAGEFDDAYKILSRDLSLDFPLMEDDTAGDRIRRDKWRSGRNGDGEDYAALAVAAHFAGHPAVAQRATEVAEERGADMTAIRTVLAES